jgi:hypothetical protein
MPVHLDAGRAGGERALVALDQSAGQHPLGLADRAAQASVELHREVGDAAGRDVAATSTLRRRTMPRSITAVRAAG